MMERLLKDCLVECPEGSGICHLVTCTVCGRTWKSATLEKDAACVDGNREAAAKEVSQFIRICNFCGRPVCEACFEDVEGIFLCVQCGEKLRKRLED